MAVVKVSLDQYETKHCIEDITEHYFVKGDNRYYVSTEEHVAILTWYRQCRTLHEKGFDEVGLLLTQPIGDDCLYLYVVPGDFEKLDRLDIQTRGYSLYGEDDTTVRLVNTSTGKSLRYRGLATCLVGQTHSGAFCYRPSSPRAVQDIDPALLK